MKKLLSLVIALLFAVSGTLCTFAEEVIPEYAYEDSEVYEEANYYEPVLEEVSLYFNGEKLENPPCEDYGYVQYTAVAKALGYETTFDGETRTITSGKDATVISFQIDSFEASVMEYDSEEILELYNTPIIFDGKTYIYYRDISVLFDYFVTQSYDEDYNMRVDIIDTEIFRQPLIEAFKLTEEYASKLPEGEFALTSNVDFDIVLQSKYLGLTVEGGSDMSLTLKRGTDSYYAKLTMKNEGIFNIYNLILGLVPHYATEETYKNVDFNAPVEIELMADTTGVYLKSDVIMPVIVTSHMEYAFEPEEIAKAKGKWINVWESDATGEIAKFLDMVTSNSPVAMADTVIQSLENTATYGANYDTIKNMIDSVSEFVGSQNYKISERNGKKTVTLTVDEEAYRKYFKSLLGSELNNMDWLWDAFKISGSGKTVSGKNGMESGESKVSMGIPKFPNKFGFDFGGFEMTVSETDKITAGKQTMPKITSTYALPEIEYEDYYEETDFEI